MTTEKTEPRIVKRSNRTKKIILLAKSDISGQLAPTDWGSFQSVGEAELFARKTIKGTPWAVGEQQIKRDAFGKVLEVKYEPVTQIFNPRHYDEE